MEGRTTEDLRYLLASGGILAPVVPVEQGSLKEYLHIFARDCEMRLLIDGAPTQEAIDRLIGYLELGKEDLPSEKELEAQSEQPTIEMPAPAQVVDR